MFTTEEAEKSYCPMVRFSQTVVDLEADTKRYRCITTACMMWRWFDYEIKAINGGESYPSVRESIIKDNMNRRGYCGLGGKP